MAGRAFPGEVWLRPQRNGRGFGLDELAQAAVRILDADGLEGLTMRRTAADLGVATTSSLYWRVRNKAELLEVSLDAVVGEALRTASEADPHQDLRAQCGDLYERLMAHPWSPALLATASGLGPSYLALSTRLVRALRAVGAPEPQLGAALSLLLNYTIGTAVTTSGWQATRTARAVDDAELVEAVAARSGNGDDGLLTGLLRHAVSQDPDQFFWDGLDLALDAVGAVRTR